MSGARLSKAVLALVAGGATASAIAVQFVGEKEGLSLRAYRDGAGIWTICRGHTAGVRPGQTATTAQCDALLTSDLGQSFDDVDSAVHVPLTEAQRAAVVSFCAYNLGMAKCRQSTFLRKLNAGDYAGACAEIPKWVYVGGKDCRDPANNCQGIVERRQQEAELCRH